MHNVIVAQLDPRMPPLPCCYAGAGGDCPQPAVWAATVWAGQADEQDVWGCAEHESQMLATACAMYMHLAEREE